MAIIIPALKSCLSRMTAGKKKVVNLLESHLEDDYYCWYDVAIGRQSPHPDFIILHPSRGLLVLEVKDWQPSVLIELSKDHAVIVDNVTGENTKVANPISQVRHYIMTLINILSKDPRLNMCANKQMRKDLIGYGYGVVLSNITRKEFDDGALGHAIPDHCVICQDELMNIVTREELQHRLWGMSPSVQSSTLSLAQIDRIRWHIFPELRVGEQFELFSVDDERKNIVVPDVVKVMDLQQELLARSLGEGHRVVHGVTGSGKTMILSFRAEYLAKVAKRPILVLCYNRNLAASLKSTMEKGKINHKVHVRTFHQWCHQQLSAFNIPKSQNTDVDRMSEENIQKMIDCTDKGIIPKGQYDAILIDEGHDFKDAWYQLIVQMVNPHNPCLLVLYDDAQSIDNEAQRKIIFSHVGIQARGRTTILQLNYRNTREILTVAKLFAEELLKARRAVDDDSIPFLEPVGAGVNGSVPLLIKLPTIQDEFQAIIQTLSDHQKEGKDWRDMAVLCRTNGLVNSVEEVLRDNGIPVHWHDIEGEGVHLMTMDASKGLEFPLVCIPCVGNQDVCDEPEENEAQLLYVAITRATRNLVMTCDDASMFAPQLESAIFEATMGN